MINKILDEIKASMQAIISQYPLEQNEDIFFEKPKDPSLEIILQILPCVLQNS